MCDQYHLDLEAHLNTEMCNWDGGDCCISTCVTSDGTECDYLVYACLDPAASDYGDTSVCNFCVILLGLLTDIIFDCLACFFL